jgi:Hypothetical protein (DUF2513)
MKRDYGHYPTFAAAAPNRGKTIAVKELLGTRNHIQRRFDGRCWFGRGRRRAGRAGDAISVAMDRMTWSGHDFLDAVRDETLWKGEADSNETASFMFEIVREWLNDETRSPIRGTCVI